MVWLLFNRDFVRLWLAMFLISFAFNLLLPVLPLFAASTLGASTGEVGLVTGLFTLTAVLSRPFFGWALDSVGRRPVLLLALALFVVMAASYNIAASLGIFLVFRLIHGVSWGAIMPATGTVAADLLPSSRLGEGLAVFGLALSISMVAATAGEWLLQWGFSAVYWAAAGVALLSLGVASLIRMRPVAGVEPGSASLSSTPARFSLTQVWEPRVLHLAVVVFLACLGYGGMLAFIALYARELGLGDVGLFFLVVPAAMVPVQYFAGKLLDRQGPALGFTLSLILLGAGLLLLGSRPGAGGFLVAGGLVGAGFGGFSPISQLMNVKMVSVERRGVANAMYFIFMDLGIASGSFVLGWVAGVWSFSVAYTVAGLLMVPALVYLWLVVLPGYRRLSAAA